MQGEDVARAIAAEGDAPRPAGAGEHKRHPRQHSLERPFHRVQGHLHRRIQRPLPTAAGELLQVGATSASLHHDDADRMAGYNLYEIGATGEARVEAWVYSPTSQTFQLQSVPKLV